jgi:hypothetical protein
MKKLKIGTKVFDIRFGWGEVSTYQENTFYVIFGQVLQSYEYNGKWSVYDINPTLSLTEYSLEKGGFTPIDTEPPLQVGEMAYFWNENPYSLYLVLSSFDGVTYSDKVITSCGFIMDKASREIPQWFLDKFQNK